MPMQVVLETRVVLKGGAFEDVTLTRVRVSGEAYRPAKTSDLTVATDWLYGQGYDLLSAHLPRQKDGVGYARYTFTRATV
jgi:hypothetical protein